MFKSVFSYVEIGVAILIGGLIGTFIALKIKMTALPQLVAAFHSLVGLAAVFVAGAAFYDPVSFNIGEIGFIATSSLIEMSLGTFIGAITFSGSILALWSGPCKFLSSVICFSITLAPSAAAIRTCLTS